MIAVDTNVLVYAHRRDSAWHEQAAGAVRELAEGLAPWIIPWPCIHEFLAITTHARIFNPPSPLPAALDQVTAWKESPTLSLAAETDGHWDTLRDLAERGRLAGPVFHDARIAAICLGHGVNELWSADRDFSRFAGLRVVNPLTR